MLPRRVALAAAAVLGTALPADAAVRFGRFHHVHRSVGRTVHRAAAGVKVVSVGSGSITVREHHTAVVPGHVVPGHVTPPHLVGGVHPHVVPAHATAPHATAPHLRQVSHTYTFDLAANVTVRVAGQSGTADLSAVKAGESIRLSVRPGTAGGRAVVTAIDVLSPRPAPPAAKN